MDKLKNVKNATPMLLPVEPSIFWQKLRMLVREEVSRLEIKPAESPSILTTPGLTYKPLLKIAEICQLFQVSRPTIYDWIKHGKLRPVKVRSRVFFRWEDIQQLLTPTGLPGIGSPAV